MIDLKEDKSLREFGVIALDSNLEETEYYETCEYLYIPNKEAYRKFEFQSDNGEIIPPYDDFWVFDHDKSDWVLLTEKTHEVSRELYDLNKASEIVANKRLNTLKARGEYKDVR